MSIRRNANGDIRLQPPLPYFRAHGTVREPYDDVGRFQERITGLSSPSVPVREGKKAEATVGQLGLSPVYKRTCASTVYSAPQKTPRAK